MIEEIGIESTPSITSHRVSAGTLFGTRITVTCLFKVVRRQLSFLYLSVSGITRTKQMLLYR